MQTVPSLVGTGTAIGAAATGLVFGQPPESESHAVPFEPRERPTFLQQDPSTSLRPGILPRSRPATSSATPAAYTEASRHHTLPSQKPVSRPPLSRYQRPHSSQISPSRASVRPTLPARSTEYPMHIEPSRDSISSNSSWLRRLSPRPLSQHGSPRSSIGPDSPSITFSHGSAAPILAPSGSAVSPLPPNKLVKRTPSTSNRDYTAAPRPRTRSHLPALRRPATSHQRSATLSQQQPEFGLERPVYLVKPRIVSTASAPAELFPTYDIEESITQPAEEPEDTALTPDHTPSKQAKRSMSMTFSAASNWVARTSGSIRRQKRGTEPKNGNKRIVSDPVSTSHSAVEPDSSTTTGDPYGSRHQSKKQGSTLDSASNEYAQRQRNASSPLPPLSRLSSFHVDLARLGSSSGASGNPTRPNQSSGSSASSTAMSQLRAPQGEKTPTYVHNADGDVREYTSADDDDTDFKSDTMFDSLRTVASGRVRTVETSLDSMYDESPPSTAGNGKNKRLSIQEILGNWDEDNKIMEEDENSATPVKVVNRDANVHFAPPVVVDPRFSTESSANDQASSARDPGRFSLDDDFEDDWARDDDAPCNALSPPSRGSPANSRAVNPNIRLALSTISGNGTPEGGSADGNQDRPLSHLFDWSEPSALDKQEERGKSLRPKTAYAKQETDSRGGRPSMRKGPTPTHVRSQSVPVVHDGSEDPKPGGSKYGTWGMGTKTASEDWDDDFEFGGSNLSNGRTNGTLFSVPESIQATQPSVKAHSGQIREFSLLVNDLKRLCRHARDLDILEGQHSGWWKEAEGIIALASPDEDSLDQENQTPPPPALDAFEASERSWEDAFDSVSFDRLDASFDGAEPVISKTAVVRERHSPRRRSVFSPEDDIFGNWPLVEDQTQPNRPSRPRTPEDRLNKTSDMSGIVKSVMEAVQRSSSPDISQPAGYPKNSRVHFDTNSLKALVKRAGELRDSLAEIIRKADQISQSPARTPRYERHRESSPAFTRVFEDPGSSPPRRITRSRGTTPMKENTSPENSPSSGLSRRVQVMRVG
ncbi:hypothetical protein S7711_04947 [Stachybotrys chartarum IBT 7711]|uniref:Uncharacterized protein n=1 Tax=Stachybotrys chartarum (strain CBS 109288 / IBT 7711) TaxID=1280523 RepID=A0A084AV36_STACB|nr:hypothetical protein S7711_04947 [Stachybotrys chartarum IBT 7711]